MLVVPLAHGNKWPISIRSGGSKIVTTDWLKVQYGMWSFSSAEVCMSLSGHPALSSLSGIRSNTCDPCAYFWILDLYLLTAFSPVVYHHSKAALRILREAYSGRKSNMCVLWCMQGLYSRMWNIFQERSNIYHWRLLRLFQERSQEASIKVRMIPCLTVCGPAPRKFLHLPM